MSPITTSAPICVRRSGFLIDTPVEVAIETRRLDRRRFFVETQAVDLHHPRIGFERLHLDVGRRVVVEQPALRAGPDDDPRIGPTRKNAR